MFKFTDSVNLRDTRVTNEGYLVAEARAVRTGIQHYLGDEVGRPDLKVVRVYRAPEEVFSDASLQSFTHAPITVNHPSENVTAANWKDLAVGEVSTMAKKDGEWVHLPLILKDAASIKSVHAGKRELSAGYSCELDWTAGVTADGQAYDAQQKNIRINHLAIVDAARAGSKARIGDSAGKTWGVAPFIEDEGEKVMPTKVVVVDGFSVETTDAGAQAIEKLMKDRDAGAQLFIDAEKKHETAMADALKAHETALAAKDAALVTKDKEIATKDAALDAEKKKVLSDVDLDKRVTARGDLIAKANMIAKDVKTEGLSDSAIRKAAVLAALGDEAVKDKTEAYIDARFDILVEDATKAGGNKQDSFQSVRMVGVQSNVADSVKARTEAEERDRNAWKTKAA